MGIILKVEPWPVALFVTFFSSYMLKADLYREGTGVDPLAGLVVLFLPSELPKWCLGFACHWGFLVLGCRSRDIPPQPKKKKKKSKTYC